MLFGGELLKGAGDGVVEPRAGEEETRLGCMKAAGAVPASSYLGDDDLAQNGLGNGAKESVDEGDVAESGLTVAVGDDGDLRGEGDTQDTLDELSGECQEHGGSWEGVRGEEMRSGGGGREDSGEGEARRSELLRASMIRFSSVCACLQCFSEL